MENFLSILGKQHIKNSLPLLSITRIPLILSRLLGLRLLCCHLRGAFSLSLPPRGVCSACLEQACVVATRHRGHVGLLDRDHGGIYGNEPDLVCRPLERKIRNIWRGSRSCTVQLLRCHYVSRHEDCGKEILRCIDRIRTEFFNRLTGINFADPWPLNSCPKVRC